MAALAMRAGTRVLVRQAGHASFLVKAMVGGLGTYGIGRALCILYERDVDYSRLNDAVSGAVGRMKGLVVARQDPVRA